MKKPSKSRKPNSAKTRKASTIEITNKASNMAILSISQSSFHHGVAVDNMDDDAVKPNGTMVLLGKVKVESGFFELVEFEFNEIYPHLLENAGYTPQDLIGEPLWADLTGLAQRQAIFCLKHLATLPDSPLVDVSGPRCGSASFQIAFTSTQNLS